MPSSDDTVVDWIVGLEGVKDHVLKPSDSNRLHARVKIYVIAVLICRSSRARAKMKPDHESTRTLH